MRTEVRKWGNSAAVRIPASIMAAVSLRIGQEIEMREKDGRIIIEPLSTPVYDLDALLDEMEPDAFPDDVDFGPPREREVW